MIDAAQLAKAYARNSAILGMQTAGLAHEQSLLQTPWNVNCLNWALGHILLYRDRSIVMAGGQPQFASEELERYQRESEPITADGPGVIRLDRLVAAVDVSQQLIDEVIGGLTNEEFAAESEVDGRMLSLARRLHFDYFHDTYHTGQTEILRQVAGTDDKII